MPAWYWYQSSNGWYIRAKVVRTTFGFPWCSSTFWDVYIEPRWSSRYISCASKVETIQGLELLKHQYAFYFSALCRRLVHVSNGGRVSQEYYWFPQENYNVFSYYCRMANTVIILLRSRQAGTVAKKANEKVRLASTKGPRSAESTRSSSPVTTRLWVSYICLYHVIHTLRWYGRTLMWRRINYLRLVW